MFSGVISTNWTSNIFANNNKPALFQCYTSWVRNKDLMIEADIDAAGVHDDVNLLRNGIFCPNDIMMSTISCFKTGSEISPWIEIDLKTVKQITCIKIQVKKKENFVSTNFKDVQIFIGNFSKSEGESKNELVYYFPGEATSAVSIKVYLESVMWARYIIIQSNASGSQILQIGQLLVIGV